MVMHPTQPQVILYDNKAKIDTDASKVKGLLFVAEDTEIIYQWNGSTFTSIEGIDTTKIPLTQKGVVNGVSTLDSLGKIPITQVPTLDNIEEGTVNKYFTATEKTKLVEITGTNTGDETDTTIQTKRPIKTIEGKSLEGSGNVDLTKSNVGLNNVDNTSDVNKPISTATQTGLDTKTDKVSGATANNIAMLDANGDLVDSGIPKSEIHLIRAIYGYQDFAAGAITSANVTLTANENGTSAPFIVGNILGGAFIVRSDDEKKYAYTSTNFLFSSKIKVNSISGAAIVLSGIPHSSYPIRIYYKISSKFYPSNHTFPSKILSPSSLDDLNPIIATQEELDLKEDSANKGVANGYTPLDSSSKVPASYLNLTDYFNQTTETLDNITQGTTNKHFTNTEKTNLSTLTTNTSGANTGDETPASIQSKRPLKTVNSESLDGAGNISVITEAPIDGNSYLRRNGAWAIFTNATFISENTNWTATVSQATIQAWYDANCDGVSNTGASPSALFSLPIIPSNSNYHIWVDKDKWYYKLNSASGQWTNMILFGGNKNSFGANVHTVAGRN